MDEEGADRAGDRPQREVQRLDIVTIGREDLLDQDDRADGDENVLAEEEADIVGRRRHRLHVLGRVLV